MFRSIALVLVVVSTGMMLSAAGQEAAAPQTQAKPQAEAAAVRQLGQSPRVGVGLIERKLTLAEAIRMALAANIDIQIERTNLASAFQFLKAAHGPYDGLFRWQPSWEDRTTPTSSVLFGADGKLAESFHNQNFSFLQRLRWQGASAQLSFDNNRITTTNPFVSLNPTVGSRLLLSFSQPLWRNRLIDRERTELKVRAKNTEITKLDLELRVVEIVARVELGYWDLVAARQDAAVNLDGVEWGREQLARNRRMIAAGTLAPVELAAAEAELERRLDTYYASLAVITQAENELKTLVSGGREDEIWNDVLIPTDERTVDLAQSDDLNEAVKTAIERRPELRHVNLRRENNATERQLAVDQFKPQVNLVAGYANSGLAGTIPASAADNPFARSNELTFLRLNELSARAGLAPIQPPSFGGGAPTGLIGGYGSTLSNLFGGNYQTFQVGLAMDWNVRNRAGEANIEQTVIAERRLKLERTRTEQAIAAQVRNAMQFIQTARQRIVAADASAKAAKDKLDSETRLFQNGESTNFLVLTRQNEFSDSRRRALVARLEFNKAVARLRQALGTSLETHQVRVE